MNRKKWIIAITALLILGIISAIIFVRGRENYYEVTGSFNQHYEGGYSTDLTVIVKNYENKSEAELAADIMEKYVANDYLETMFLFDEYGYANTINVKAYKSEKKIEAGEKYLEFTAEKSEDEPEVRYNCFFILHIASND